MSTMKIVTFNARYVYFDRDNSNDGIRSFVFRAGFIYDKIQREQPDIILFQELTKDHLAVLEGMLGAYDFIGHFRNKDFGGEGVFTAVRKDRIQVLGFDSYWLSPTPYVPGSRYEKQSTCPRTCLTVKVRDRESGKIFRVLNTHLDHWSDEARILGIRQILNRVCGQTEEDCIPFVLCGDFNAIPTSDTIQYCKSFDRIKLYDITEGIAVTYHEWGTKQEKIDYIFVTAEFKNSVQSVYVWDDEIYGMYLSDHYPVCAQLVME